MAMTMTGAMATSEDERQGMKAWTGCRLLAAGGGHRDRVRHHTPDADRRSRPSHARS
jgi:hypothetical protein